MNSMVNGPISILRAGFHRMQLGFILQAVFFQPPLHHLESERRAVNRNVDLAQQERHRADVIFMAVRQDQRADHLAMLLQIREVRSDDVDTQQFRIGKHHAGIDDDDVVPVADGHGIHSELAQAAERDQLKLMIRHVRFRLSVELQPVAGSRLARDNMAVPPRPSCSRNDYAHSYCLRCARV